MAVEISKLAVVLGGSIAGFSASMKAAGRDLDGFVSGAQGAAGRFASFTASIAGVGTGLAGLGAIATGIKLAASFEQTTVAMTTMLKSADTAKAVLSELTRFAAETPFEFPELKEAATKLIAFGTSASRLIPTLRMLGDISAGIGAPIGEIAELYGKARVQGRLYAIDVMQFTNRGIPLIQELAKQFKVSESAIKGLVESGQVSFANLQQAFVTLTSAGGQFAGMMQAQSQTITGLFSTLKDTVGIALRNIGETIIRELNLKESLKSAIETAERFGKKVGAVVVALIRWTKEHKEQIKTVLKWVAAIGGAAFALNKLIQIGRGVVSVIQAIVKAQVVALALSGPAGWLVLAGGAIVAAAAVYGVSAAFDGISEAAAEVAAESERVANSQNQVAQATENLDAAADMAAAKQQQLAQSIADVETKLRDQVATFGKSATQVEIWKLAQEGATDAQLENLRALEFQLQTMERLKKAQEDMATEAKRWQEAIKTPAEKMEEQLAAINNLEAFKLLSPEEAQRAAEKVADEFERTQARSSRKLDFKLAPQKVAALERRFTAGFDREVAAGPQEKLLAEAKKHTRIVERQAKATEKLVTNLQEEVVRI